MTDFICDFFLGPINKEKSLIVSFSDREIELFSDLYSEKIFIEPVQHYHAYTSYYSSYINSNMGNNKVEFGQINSLLKKHKAPFVSGAIGESISMIALLKASQKNNQNYPFQRLYSTIRCPDYILKFKGVPELLNLWNLDRQIQRKVPDFIPMEVKSNIKHDGKNLYKEDFAQLASYWNESERVLNYEESGYGIVSIVNLFLHNIKFHLFIPKVHPPHFSRNRSLAFTDSDGNIKLNHEKMFSENDKYFCE